MHDASSLSGPSPIEGSPGFSLIEVVVAALIATIAVFGLAHTFGLGRTFIDRYAIARAALGAARARLETLAAGPAGSPDLATTPPVHTAPFTVDGRAFGQEAWIVGWVDDPTDGLQGAGDLNPNDLKRVTVTVTFREGAVTDSVRLTRLLLR